MDFAKNTISEFEQDVEPTVTGDIKRTISEFEQDIESHLDQWLKTKTPLNLKRQS